MTTRPPLCGVGDPHPIKSCLVCHRIDMRQRRAAKSSRPKQWGFRGPECLECGGVRAKVMESGFTDAGQRIRRRVCMDCGQDAASVEVYIDPAETTFWHLNGSRARRKRENDYRRKGKGLYRIPSRWVAADRLDVRVRVIHPTVKREDAA